MALLHEKLYQSDSLSEIEMGSYLQTLAGEILRMNSGTGSSIDLQLDIDDIRLGIDTALPCGLVVTELVTNSLKYAFPDTRQGVIRVGLTRADGGEYSLLVQDNGVGIPPGFDPSSCDTLGMRLVTMLAAQLNGTVQTSGSGGTRNRTEIQGEPLQAEDLIRV